MATTLTFNKVQIGDITIINPDEDLSNEEYCPVYPQNFSFEGDIPNEGHFGNGVWITPISTMIKHFWENTALKHPELFEVKEKYLEYIFKNGAVVGVTFHERILGNFTKEEILHQFVDANKMIKWW